MGKIEKFFEKIENIFNSKYGNIYAYGIVLILCFFIMLGQNFRLETVDDDVYHTKAVEKFGSAYKFMIAQYENTNGRYFTSLVMSFVMDKNIWLWRILNAFVLFGLIYFLNNIIRIIYHTDKKANIITLFGIFASIALLSTGIWTQSITWVTGSFNYLWPATALIISLYYLFNFIFNKISMKLYEFILLIPVVLYAANSEQSALIFSTMYILGMVYAFIKYRTLNIYLVILFLFGSISTYFLFTAPSLSIRYMAEIKNWYPQFINLSLFDKIILGYAYTIAYGILLNNYQTTIALSILLYIIYRKINKNNYRKLSIIILLPAIYSLLYYIGRVNIDFTNSLFIYNLVKYSRQFNDNNINEPFISLIISLFLLFIMFYFMFKIKWSSIERKYLAILFFSASIMSAFILSFSPTIFASGERIWFIPYIMYILALALVFMEALKYIDISSNKFKIIFSIYVIVGVIDVFSKVYR